MLQDSDFSVSFVILYQVFLENAGLFDEEGVAGLFFCLGGRENYFCYICTHLKNKIGP